MGEVKGGGRVKALDGIRGVAALIVVIGHVLLIYPQYLTASGPHPEDTKGVGRLLAFTPLKFFTAGTEAVFLFFVLSGYVLIRPYVVGGAHSWADYFGRRLARLYLPVWGALVFASATIYMVHRPATTGNWWLDMHPHSFPFVGALNDAMLVHDPRTLTTVLWSLKYEVVFSLLLPLFVVLAKVSSRRPYVALLAIALLMGSSPKTGLMFLYLPMFAIGGLLVATQDRWEPAIRALPNAVHVGALAVAVLLVTSRGMLTGVIPHQVSDGSTKATTLITGCVLLATVGVVIILVEAIAFSPFTRMVSTRPVVWLGTVSYSLYLLHEPIVVTLAFATHGWNVPAAGLAIVLSLVAADVFYRLVEKRALTAAAAIGPTTERLASAATAGEPAPVMS